jgi:hypothetical protein
MRCAAFVLYVAAFAVYSWILPVRTPDSVRLFLGWSALHSLLGVVIMMTGVCVLSRRAWWLLFLLPRVLVFPMQPWLSDDVYRYLWDGAVLAHGINPYLHPPDSEALQHLIGHPGGRPGTAELLSAVQSTIATELFPILDYKTYTTLYPPLSQLVFAGCAFMGETLGAVFPLPAWALGLACWKLCLLASETLGFWCIVRLMSTMMVLPAAYQQEHSSYTALGYYCLLPLPVIEVVGQAHLDGLLIAPLGMSILAALHRRWLLCGACIAVLGLVKILPVVLIVPVCILLPSWRSRTVLVVGFFVVVIAGLLPFFHEQHTGTVFVDAAVFANRAFQFNGGVYYILCYILHWLHVEQYWVVAPTVLTVLRGGVLFAVILWSACARRYVPKYLPNPVSNLTPTSFLFSSLFWVLAVVILVAAKVHTWYFVPLLLLNVFTRWKWLWVLAVSSMLSYAYYAFEPFAERYVLELWGWGISLAILLYEVFARFYTMRIDQVPGDDEHSVERVA